MRGTNSSSSLLATIEIKPTQALVENLEQFYNSKNDKASKVLQTALEHKTALNHKLSNEVREMKLAVEDLNKVLGQKDKIIKDLEKKDLSSELEIKKLQGQIAAKQNDDIKHIFNAKQLEEMQTL